MAVFQGFVGKVGAVSGAEPVGRITLMDAVDQSAEVAQVHCPSGPRLDVAMLARQLGQLVEVDVQATTSPMVADKIRML